MSRWHPFCSCLPGLGCLLCSSSIYVPGGPGVGGEAPLPSWGACGLCLHVWGWGWGWPASLEVTHCLSQLLWLNFLFPRPRAGPSVTLGCAQRLPMEDLWVAVMGLPVGD